MRCAASIIGISILCLVSVVTADDFGTGVNQFEIDFVTIPGSAGDGYGGQSAGPGFTTTNIAQDYRIGTYEITNDQWDKFEASLGVPVTGVPSHAYDEEACNPHPNVPTECVSWYEVAQFVNWLNTSTGHQPAYNFTGVQGTDNYTFALWSPAEADGGTDLYRHKDAFYFLPTEDEWVKAAYWNGAELQEYATRPGETLYHDYENDDGWNYDSGDNNPYGPGAGGSWDVGSGSEELSGTYDMMGNIVEWTESSSDGGYGADSIRAQRGSGFIYWEETLSSSFRFGGEPGNDTDDLAGFRVASAVPEPASMSLLALGGVAVLRRRKK